MLGMVESTVTRNDHTSHERRYYVCSTRLDPVTFGRAVRAHWRIENNLHWVLDVVFHDDLARLRTDHAAANMAVIRHMAVNCLRTATPDRSFKCRRKRAAWSPDYVADLISGHA